VITQETGFTRYYGGNKRGLFAFQTREINADYVAHCRAAFEIAAEVFEAEGIRTPHSRKLSAGTEHKTGARID